MEGHKKTQVQFWLGIVVLVACTVFLLSYDISGLLSTIGLTNAYILVFIFALFAGLVFVTSAVFYSTVIALVVAGTHPLILALVAGLGLFIGDTFVFHVGKKGRETFNLDAYPKIHHFSKWLVEKPTPYVIIFILLYGLSPFPNEILMLSLSVLGYQFRKIWWALLCADILIIILIAELTMLGVAVV